MLYHEGRAPSCCTWANFSLGHGDQTGSISLTRSLLSQPSRAAQRRMAGMATLIIHQIRELCSRQWSVNLTQRTVKGTASRTCLPTRATLWLLTATSLPIVARTSG
ncbi:hypothetical protein LINPERPRIM_LOCUS14240 [Linum perenne]